jgi:MFS family permease
LLRSFTYFLIAILIVSTIVDEVVVMSLLFGVVNNGNQSISIALLLLFQLIPAVLLSPYGGHTVDKYGAKKIVIITGLLEIPALLALSFANSTFHVYSLSAVMSALFAFSGPAIFALIPPAAARASISVERANSLIEVVGGMGAIAGPVVGGLLVGQLPLSSAIQLTAIWSALVVVFLSVTDLNSPLSDDQEKISNFLTQMKMSYRPIMRIRQIKFLFVTFFTIVFSTTFSDVIFVFFSTINLRGGPILVGILIAAWSLGLTIGAWYVGREKEPETVIRFAYLGAIGMGISLFLTGAASGFFEVSVAVVAVGILFVAGGFSNGVHNVAVRASIFKFVPKGQHGRAYSLYSLITRVAAVFGYFSGGLVGKDNAVIVYLMSGILAISFGGIGLFVFGRYIREQMKMGTIKERQR